MKDELSNQLNKAGGGLKSFGGSLQSAGANLTAMTAPLAAFGASGVKMAVDLDTAMRNIQAISKQTDEEIAALSDTFVDMSTDITKTTDTAQNLAEAFYDIQGSGFAGEDAMKVLEAATKAATAGLTETGQAAEGITAVLNSYGKSADEASHISDLMFRTVDRGVGSFGELSSSMSNVVGMANAIGVPFEEVSAAMATMSKQGFSFSEASVAINQAMSSLIKPTADGRRIIQEMGYESGEAMVKALGFAGALEAVADHTGGSVTEMSHLFGNVRGLRAALALTGEGATMFAEDLAAMNDATGATAESFATQTKAFSAQWANFKNTLAALAIEIGQIIIPVLTSIMNAIKPMIQAFRGLPEPVQKVIVIIGMLITVLGPLLIIIGSVISAVGTIVPAFAALGAIVPVISAAFAAAPAIIGAFVAALGTVALPVTALIATLVALKTAWDKNVFGLRDKIQEVPSVWRKNFEMLGEIVRLAEGKIATAIQGIVTKIANSDFVQTMLTFGKNLIQGLINGIGSMITSLVNKVKEMASRASNAVKSAFGIHSPSKLMMKYGEQVVEGFNKGIDTMGGLGVTTPAMAGASGGMPMVGGAGIGGGNVYIGTINVPPGTTQEQIDIISRELGKRAKRRGAVGG